MSTVDRAGSGPALVTMTLRANRPLGDAYRVLELDGEPGPARSGQFAMLRGDWGGSPFLPRPMSWLSIAPRPSVLIKVVGEGTRRMATAAPGERFAVLTPLGRPFADAAAVDVATRAVLVAGGVGVAPLLWLAEELAAAGAPRPVALYGGRTAHDLPLAERLAELADLRVTTEDGSAGTRGRVTVVLDELLARAPGATVFTCGPTPMMAAVARAAAERSLRCVAALEAPMACGYGVCLGCVVPRADGGFLYVCSDGPCVDAAAVAWRQG